MDILIWGFALLLGFSIFSAIGHLLNSFLSCFSGTPNTPTRAEKKLAEIEELLAQIEQTQQEHQEHLAQMQAMNKKPNLPG